MSATSAPSPATRRAPHLERALAALATLTVLCALGVLLVSPPVS